MAEYYIAPKSSFDATADAIREKTGSQATIEWTEDGFADAIEDIPSGGEEPYKSVVTGTAVSFSSDISTLAPNLFRSNNTIKSISCPNVTYINTELCRMASNLESVNFRGATYIGGNAFMQCPKLTGALVFPVLESVSNSGFSNINNIEVIDILGGDFIYTGFQNDGKLVTLILRASTITTLNHINSFNGTPFASDGTGGTLYVPSALVSQYTQATNWSTILAYTNNQIKSIESTHTDPNATIDLTLYYVDGTPIPTT